MTRLQTALVASMALVLLSPVLGVAQICGTQTRHPRTYAHVIWIWMENHSYSTIVGSADAPYINGLIASCGVAANYHNISHPSLPNYVGAVTGLPVADLGQFLTDCKPSADCSTAAPSLFDQVPSWKGYMDSMTTNCQPMGFVGYAVRHNPPPYLTTLANCGTYDVPYTALQADLDNDTLPAFSFITPNTIHDMHDGTDPTAIQNGDAWLQSELPNILNSAAYQSGTTVVFVTFDEGEPETDAGKDCARDTTDESCHIPTIVLSPFTRPGTVSMRLFNHYSLLRTTEQLLGVRPGAYLGRARRAHGMRAAFRL